MDGTQLEGRGKGHHGDNKDEYVVLNLTLKAEPAEGKAMGVQEKIVIVYVGIKLDDGNVWAVKQAVKVITEEEGGLKERELSREEKGIMPTWLRANARELQRYEGETTGWFHISHYGADFTPTADMSFLPYDNEDVPDEITNKLSDLLLAYNLSLHMKELKQNVPMVLHVFHHADEHQKFPEREERFFFVKSKDGAYGKSLMVDGGESYYVRFTDCQDCESTQEHTKTVPGWFHRKVEIFGGDKNTICIVKSEDIPADILDVLNHMGMIYIEL